MTTRRKHERTCLTTTPLLSLLVQMDPVMILFEGHRPDMFLDLSGMTREERAMI